MSQRGQNLTLEIEAIIAILGITIPVLGSTLGIKWQQAKTEVQKVTNEIQKVVHTGEMVTVLKLTQALNLIDIISTALEDDTITAKEAKQIKAQIQNIVRTIQ